MKNFLIFIFLFTSISSASCDFSDIYIDPDDLRLIGKNLQDRNLLRDVENFFPNDIAASLLVFRKFEKREVDEKELIDYLIKRAKISYLASDALLKLYLDGELKSLPDEMRYSRYAIIESYKKVLELRKVSMGTLEKANEEVSLLIAKSDPKALELLGDIYFKKEEYEISAAFYFNAINEGGLNAIYDLGSLLDKKFPDCKSEGNLLRLLAKGVKNK